MLQQLSQLFEGYREAEQAVAIAVVFFLFAAYFLYTARKLPPIKVAGSRKLFAITTIVVAGIGVWVSAAASALFADVRASREAGMYYAVLPASAMVYAWIMMVAAMIVAVYTWFLRTPGAWTARLLAVSLLIATVSTYFAVSKLEIHSDMLVVIHARLYVWTCEASIAATLLAIPAAITDFVQWRRRMTECEIAASQS